MEELKGIDVTILKYFFFDRREIKINLISESLDSIDFYELLIECQNAPDPVLRLQLEALRWYAPVLAVFATFYQVN
jgi:hypothetical protein